MEIERNTVDFVFTEKVRCCEEILIEPFYDKKGRNDAGNVQDYANLTDPRGHIVLFSKLIITSVTLYLGYKDMMLEPHYRALVTVLLFATVGRTSKKQTLATCSFKKEGRIIGLKMKVYLAELILN